MSLSIVILAAGQGTRMRSRLPKVLHRLAGRTLLEHVWHTASALPHTSLSVVYGYGGRQVPETLGHLDAMWVEQKEQLGTGHAVAQALPHLADDDDIMILYGDVPLINSDTLLRLQAAAAESGFALLTASVGDPCGYGRIVRNKRGDIQRIVEEKDASGEERAIREINTGMMVVRGQLLKRWLSELDNHNRQGEYYLTDIVAMAAREHVTIETVYPQKLYEIAGVNDRIQLAEAESIYRGLQARRLMRDGVTLLDPARFDLRGRLQAGIDTEIDVNVVIEGEVVLGDGVRIGANCVLRDVSIGDDTEILTHCVVEQANIGSHCRIGPFARIRPDTRLDDNVHIGNFVELKESQIGKGSKVNHLSYIGDSEIGHGVNVGAGTITCNYDGANKHRTVIEQDVFIGSDTQLVAPVRVAAGATIAAGTTVTKDVEAGTLAISRMEQRTVKGWKRPKKKDG